MSSISQIHIFTNTPLRPSPSQAQILQQNKAKDSSSKRILPDIFLPATPPTQIILPRNKSSERKKSRLSFGSANDSRDKDLSPEVSDAVKRLDQQIDELTNLLKELKRERRTLRGVEMDEAELDSPEEIQNYLRGAWLLEEECIRFVFLPVFPFEQACVLTLFFRSFNRLHDALEKTAVSQSRSQHRPASARLSSKTSKPRPSAMKRFGSAPQLETPVRRGSASQQYLGMETPIRRGSAGQLLDNETPIRRSTNSRPGSRGLTATLESTPLSMLQSTPMSMFSTTQPSDSTPFRGYFSSGAGNDGGDASSTDDGHEYGNDITTDADEIGGSFELDVYGTNELTGTGT